MADAGLVAPVRTRTTAHWLVEIARQRELSLILIMVALGAVVSVSAPQFLSASNLTNVTSLASIAAVAAMGQALVVITRSIDLSVEAIVGLVAYVVAITLEQGTFDAVQAVAVGVGLGLVLGMVNGIIVTVLGVPAIVATLGTLNIFRGIDFLIAGSHQVPVASLPAGFTDAAYDSVLGIPIFVIVTIVIVTIGTVALRWLRVGRQLYAVGSNPEAAAVLGIPSRRVIFTAYALCGLLSGVAGVMWVVQFGTINGQAATGFVLAVVAAVVVGGVNIFGGSGSLIGAVLGAFFLGFVANALILVGLSQFWLQAIYGVVILGAITADAFLRGRIQRAVRVRLDR